MVRPRTAEHSNPLTSNDPRASIFVAMTLFFGHTIASLTALSVLMCSILCACPGAAASSSDRTDKPPSHQSRGEPAVPEDAEHEDHDLKKASGHCHGEPTPTGQEDAPAQPCEDHGGKSCSHCEQPLISSADNKKPVELTPHHYFLVTFFLSLSEGTVQPKVTASKPAALSGAPPPAEWSTLLRLHCALII